VTFAAVAWEAPFAVALLRPGGWILADPAPTNAEWVVFVQADARAAPGFARLLQAAIHARPDVDLFYGDDADLGAPPGSRLRLKPEFNLPLLLANDYVGAPVVVRASALARLGGIDPAMGEAGLYDLVLRVHGAGLGVARVPQVLAAYPQRPSGVPPADRRRAVEAWIGSRPFEVAPGLTPESLQLRRRFDTFPAVTLVVPTRQSGPAGAPYVSQLLDGLAATDWPMERLQVLVGDDSDAAAVFAPARWPFAVRRVATPRPAGEPFNYAAKMNRLWRASETEHLVLMNDDVAVCGPGWLKALMTFAMDLDVGGVGARLVFPDGRLQHAGVAPVLSAPAHLWHAQSADRPTYQDWALLHRDWSMVTGAVFATRRSALEAANGFDERFSLEFNDIDLCLRLRLMGLRIVCTPFAELAHRERASRGETEVAGDQIALFFNRWREYLADDPAWHPGLSRDRLDPAPVEAPDWYG
jgi:GT2 family glycosyltransferase